MKKQEFKLGDKVTCMLNNLNSFYIKDSISHGSTHTITGVDGYWVNIDGNSWLHHAEKFKLLCRGRPGMVCIILRREADEKAMLKALQKLGFTWKGGEAPIDWSGYYLGSRVINVHVNDKNLGVSPTTGRQGKTPKAIMRDITAAGWHAYEGIVFVNTKPSVKLAISNLKAILT